MIPTLARGALFLGDAVVSGGRGLVSGPFGSSNPPHRPSCDGGSRTGSGGSGSGGSSSAAAAATTTSASAAAPTTSSLPNSSLYAIRTSSRFNFARPSFEVSRRTSVEASAQQSAKKFVRRVRDLICFNRRHAGPGGKEVDVVAPAGSQKLEKIKAPRRLLRGFASHPTTGKDDSTVSLRSWRCYGSHSRLYDVRSGGARLSISGSRATPCCFP